MYQTLAFGPFVSELVESDEDIIPARHLARVVGKIVGRVYILQDWRKKKCQIFGMLRQHMIFYLWVV